MFHAIVGDLLLNKWLAPTWWGAKSTELQKCLPSSSASCLGFPLRLCVSKGVSWRVPREFCFCIARTLLQNVNNFQQCSPISLHKAQFLWKIVVLTFPGTHLPCKNPYKQHNIDNCSPTCSKMKFENCYLRFPIVANIVFNKRFVQEDVWGG